MSQLRASFCSSLMGMTLCFFFFPVWEQRGVWAQSGAEDTELKDRPARIRNKVTPNFPLILRMSEYNRGFAKVIFLVDITGRSYDFVLIEASHPLFGEETLRTLKLWQIEPAIVDGQIHPSRHIVDVNFRNEGVVIEKRIDEMILTMVTPDSSGGTHYLIPELKELDRIPVCLEKESPVLPAGLEPNEAKGLVKIEFFIDEKGTVRAPGILMSPHDALADAAFTAVVNWKFEPPLKDGKPVAVRAVQSFFFE